MRLIRLAALSIVLASPLTAQEPASLIRGRLTLDGDVNQWLRRWRVPDTSAAEGRPVTLRALASHTAGTTVHGFEGYHPDSTLPTLPQILDGLPPANSPAVRVIRAPGREFEYSGGGTTIEQLVLEEVTGRPFAAYMYNEVLIPYGMRKSTYAQPLPRERWGNAAIGYRRDGAMVAGRWHAYPEQAAAGLWTTPSDLARMLLAVRDDLRRGSSRLSPAEARLVLEPVAGGPAGIGFFVAGTGDATRFGHGGSNEGYRAQVWMYPASGDGAVVMTNSDSGQPLASEILNTIAEAYGWPGYLAEPVTPVTLSPAELDLFRGDYCSANFPPVSITRDGEALKLTVQGDRPVDLLPTTPSTFVIVQANAGVSFPGAPERVDTMVVTLDGREFRFTRQ